MTPQEQKELAEFGAEFLGKKRVTVHSYQGKFWFDIKPSTCFELEATAPILAHLAKREMEKRGFIEFVWLLPYAEFSGVYKIRRNGEDSFRGESDNEYQALWLAIQESVK